MAELWVYAADTYKSTSNFKVAKRSATETNKQYKAASSLPFVYKQTVNKTEIGIVTKNYQNYYIILAERNDELAKTAIANAIKEQIDNNEEHLNREKAVYKDILASKPTYIEDTIVSI